MNSGTVNKWNTIEKKELSFRYGVCSPLPQTEGQSRSVKKNIVGRIRFGSFIDIFNPFSSTKPNPYTSHKLLGTGDIL